MNKIAKIATAAAMTVGIMGVAVPAANAAGGSPALPHSDSVQVGNHRVNVSVRKISSRELFLQGEDSGLVARYEVRAKRTDGRLLFDKNISVYKTVWFNVDFKEHKYYSSNASLVRALKNATNESERSARNDFRDIFGSLGKFQNADGSFSAPQQISDRN